MSTLEPTRQVPGVFHRKLGNLTLTVLNDGYIDGSFDLVTNIGKDEAERLETGQFRRTPPRLTVNAFALSGQDGVTLIDAGGLGYAPTCGLLPANLAAAGIAPDSVNRILLTHLHPDHVGALTTDQGAARFPRAELVMHANEAAFWLDPETLGRVPEEVKPFVQGAQKAAHPYEGRIRMLTEGEAAPGIAIVPEPGHTPGHSGWMITSGHERLLIWGDIVHLPGIQFARPDAGVAFDADGAAAVATRRRIFEMAAAERLLIAGMHLDYPTLGHLVPSGQGYAFIPENWVGAF